MSHIIDDEYSEIILYVTELRRKFYRKLENQIFIIEQQRDRIDYQQRQIDDQRIVIDELAWQIRDLRDSVRQCTEKINENIGCSNCVTIRKDSEITASSIRGKLNRQSHIEKEDALYESINFDRDLPTKSTTTTTTIDDPLAKVPVPKMRRQNAVAQNPSTESDEKQKRGKCSKSFVVGMIPPPPPSPSVTSLPKDANTDDDDDDDLAEFSAETMQKLNKLYEMRNFLRSSSISGAEPNETNDFDEVVYRMRDFKDFSRRSKRGSSKPMCSLVSDVETDYLPKVEDESDEMEIKEIELRRKTDENANISAKQTTTTITQPSQRTTYTKNVRSAVFI